MKLPGNVRGGLYILTAALFFATMVALIKLAGTSLHVMEILFFRQVAMVLIASPMILRSFPMSLKSKRPGLQILRVCTAFVAMTLGFTAVIHLPLAEATTIAFGKTFFTTLLAIFVLGEVVGPRRWAAVAVGFLGVVVVAWPTDGAAFNIYGLMAIGSAALVGIVMVSVRLLSRVDEPITILSFQAIGVGLLMLPGTILFWQTPTVEELLLLFTIGALAVCGQYINILGLRAGEASAVAPLDYARLVYTVCLGWWIFSEWPEPRVFVGAAIIVGAAAYTLHRERVVGKAKQAERTRTIVSD